jgi:energy-coupling factor transporter ATP-binding protein EcfA2
MSDYAKISQNYISKVHLKGYKSIQDVEIDLLPGLNIMIGPNGSGKTNFLEAINSLLEKDTRYYSVDAELYVQIFLAKNKIEIKTKQREPAKFDDLVFDNNFEVLLSTNQGKIDYFKSPKIGLYQFGLLFQYLHYFIPKCLLVINLLSKIEFDIRKNGKITGGISEFPHYSYFSARVFSKLKKIVLEGLAEKQNLKIKVVESFAN